VALLKELTPAISVYASASTGFSPPTEEEIRPSSGAISRDLQAERGTSYEAGLRGQLGGDRFTFDVAAFDLTLNQTIVTRGADNGITLFANAGTTRQRGVEAALSGWLWRQKAIGPASLPEAVGQPDASAQPTGLRAWASYAYNHFRFQQYETGGQRYTGNRLTGTAPHTLSAGLDFSERLGFYLSPTINHQADIPLNDANTEYAAGYWTFGTRGGWRHALLRGRLEADVFAGVDNATNRRYSLGNDLNAFGNRYFQPAPGRNFYVGTLLGWRW
jgi:iron complex outermembrane receptor protein